MNLDFYTMSREPDPQFSSDILQNLRANTTSESRDFSGNPLSSGFQIIGSNQMGSSDENEGIEASHILQLLSAAEDHGSPKEVTG
jgi:hypothetical protein